LIVLSNLFLTSRFLWIWSKKSWIDIFKRRTQKS